MGLPNSEILMNLVHIREGLVSDEHGYTLLLLEQYVDAFPQALMILEF